MRIRRGPATVTGRRSPHDADAQPLGGNGRPGRRGGGARSQETCLRPRSTTLEEKGDPHADLRLTLDAQAGPARLRARRRDGRPRIAAPVVADLHVEAGGQALVPGQRYSTDTTPSPPTRASPPAAAQRQAQDADRADRARHPGRRVDFDRARCARSASATSSASACSCAASAAYTATDSAFWLYKVESRGAGGGRRAVRAQRKGADVLWYFQDTAANRNTGDELAITAPARARTGRAFTVSVSAYASNGTRQARSGGAGGVPRGYRDHGRCRAGQGDDRLAGDARLRATRGADIPSSKRDRVRGQAAQRLRCKVRAAPVRHRQRGLAARLSRTRRDQPRARGTTRSTFAAARVDRVRCGSGRDTVRMSRKRPCARATARS